MADKTCKNCYHGPMGNWKHTCYTCDSRNSSWKATSGDRKFPEQPEPKREPEMITVDAELFKSLEHHKTTTVGLWATDRPDVLTPGQKDYFFEVK